MGYLEIREQILRNVLLDDNYYNGIVNARVHRNHVKRVKELWENGDL